MDLISQLEPSAPTSSLSNGFVLARFSQDAYVPPPFVFSELNHIHMARSEAVGLRPPICVVAFRGTQSPIDFVTDAKGWQETGSLEKDLIASQPLDNAAARRKVHAGFEDAYLSTRDLLEEKLADWEPEWPLYFTGHSLGGAQALRAAFRFVLRHPKLQCVTFGQPRVGNAAFAKECAVRLGLNHVRWVNQADIVARMPYMLHSYRHSGFLRFMPSIGGVWDNPPMPFLFLSDVWGWVAEARLGRNALLDDHFIKNYIDRMTAISL